MFDLFNYIIGVVVTFVRPMSSSLPLHCLMTVTNLMFYVISAASCLLMLKSHFRVYVMKKN